MGQNDGRVQHSMAFSQAYSSKERGVEYLKT